MKFRGKTQCWEYRKCGRDKTRSCPAYPDYGRLCWPIAGTKCPQGPTGDHAKAIGNCESCAFFKSVVFDGLSPEEKGTGDAG